MTIHRWLSYAAIVVLSLVSTASFAHAQTAEPNASMNPRVAAVWKREELYWRLVKAGDVDNYRALWDNGFRGWGCKPQHTFTRAKVTDWVRDIRDRKAKVTYSLTFDGAADFGDIVIVYYKTPMIFEYPDGRVVDRDRIFKFTHTWRKTGKTWHIIGGMCGELPRSTSP
jgi:hypothetical protein